MKKIPTAFAFCLLLLLSGCLEIDGQDVYLRYDEENDRIDAMFVHRGIFAEAGDEDTADALKKATTDLENAMASGEFVFWNNWPLSCDPSRDYDAPRNALLKHVEVENGGLFTDPQGILCGYQFVRVNKAKSFVKKLNTLLELGFQTATVKGIAQLGNKKLDADSKENIREFLRGRGKFLTIEQGRIELRLPLSQSDFQRFKGAIEGRFMDNMPNEITRREAVAQRRKDGLSPTNTSVSNESVMIEGSALSKEIARAPTFRFFWDNDISIERTLEVTTIGLGVAGAEEIQVKKASAGLYHDAFLMKLRADKFQIEDGLPAQELFRRFNEFQARDAKLPTKLAAKRG
tara:strand:- start:1573 stop:2610 length:1038 start_codon:yes stop_codon:yes gene_type:complete